MLNVSSRLAVRCARHGHSCPRAVSAGRATRRGAAAVEFAVVAPLLFTLILGSIEFGRVLMVGQLATNAARAGCRQGTMNGTTTDTIKSTVSTALTAGGVSGVSTSVTVNDQNVDASTAVTGDKITVQVTVSLSQNQWLPTPLFIHGGSAVVTSVMRHE
jgi:Flp pilus assembly protein TadG